MLYGNLLPKSTLNREEMEVGMEVVSQYNTAKALWQGSITINGPKYGIVVHRKVIP